MLMSDELFAATFV